MLIRHPRQTTADIVAWERFERFDAALARSPVLYRKVREAVRVILRFVDRHGGAVYASLSWGKDSTVLAGLLALLWRDHGVRLPAVWVRVEPIKNPDCALVRDAFLAEHGAAVSYYEVESRCVWRDGEWHASKTLEDGFAEFRRETGLPDNHITGIRADESALRRGLTERTGTTSKGSCRPIAHWSGDDVFAFLHRENLPVHPAYACTFGGDIEGGRARVRVSSLGGRRGTGHGRRSWEKAYYGAEMRALGFEVL